VLAPLLALAIFVVAFWFLATERADKVKTVLVAAGLMTILGLTPGEKVFYSEHEGIDWNVIFLLLGMMVIVGVIKQTGVFDFLAIWAAKRSRGKPFRLMAMLMLITAVASPVLDNVTIIMLVAPVTLVICDRLHIAPQPYLIAEVLASNVGGAATLIGDPPNIIIGSRAGLSFNDFLIHMAPAVVVIFALFVVFTRVLFRAELRGDIVHLEEVMALHERRAIKDTRLLVRSIAVLTLVVIGFSLHSVLHVAPSIIALLGAGTMLLVTNVDVGEILPEVEWPTLVFFMGLFAMVAGLVHRGDRVVGRCRGGDIRRQLLPRRHRAAVRLGGARRIRRQHPLHRHDDPGRREHGRAGTGRRDRPGAVVGIRAGSLLLRQRHRDRGQRQRRRDRNCPTRGPPDQLLAVYPLRHHRDAAQHRPGVGLCLASLLLNRGAPAIDRRGHFSGIR
jgi:Na+/H+ antiporter NhaD/arsenite permease-like protein